MRTDVWGSFSGLTQANKLWRLATTFRQYDTIFLVLSSLRILGFHRCCGAGWWMGENKSVPLWCLKFISAHFSHGDVHIHACRGLTKHITSFCAGCVKEYTCTVLPASIPEMPYVLACKLKISRLSDVLKHESATSRVSYPFSGG